MAKHSLRVVLMFSVGIASLVLSGCFTSEQVRSKQQLAEESRPASVYMTHFVRSLNRQGQQPYIDARPTLIDQSSSGGPACYLTVHVTSQTDEVKRYGFFGWYHRQKRRWRSDPLISQRWRQYCEDNNLPRGSYVTGAWYQHNKDAPILWSR